MHHHTQAVSDSSFLVPKWIRLRDYKYELCRSFEEGATSATAVVQEFRKGRFARVAPYRILEFSDIEGTGLPSLIAVKAYLFESSHVTEEAMMGSAAFISGLGVHKRIRNISLSCQTRFDKLDIHLGSTVSPPLRVSSSQAVRMAYLVQHRMDCDMFHFICSKTATECGARAYVRIFDQVCTLLMKLEGMNLHYYDIKPENVLLKRSADSNLSVHFGYVFAFFFRKNAVLNGISLCFSTEPTGTMKAMILRGNSFPEPKGTWPQKYNFATMRQKAYPTQHLW